MADVNESNGESNLTEVETIAAADVSPLTVIEPAPAAETPPEPIVEPLKPRVTMPVLPGVCPECGKGGFDSEKSLSAHIRFKHDLPRARKAAAAQKLEDARREGIPAPADFSDITGQPPPAATPVAVIPDARFEGMANMTFDMTTGLLAKIFGPEWLPQADSDNPQISHERMTMVAGIKKYYESVNLPDIPPGYMLCFLCLAYSAPRMSAQPTRTKLAQGWLWLKTKFQRRKVKPV